MYFFFKIFRKDSYGIFIFYICKSYKLYPEFLIMNCFIKVNSDNILLQVLDELDEFITHFFSVTDVEVLFSKF